MRCHHSSKAQMSLRSFTHFNAKRHAVAAFMVVSRRVRGRLMAKENCSGASDRAPERKCPTGTIDCGSVQWLRQEWIRCVESD
jgi:hypothetical protein